MQSDSRKQQDQEWGPLVWLNIFPKVKIRSAQLSHLVLCFTRNAESLVTATSGFRLNDSQQGLTSANRSGTASLSASLRSAPLGGMMSPATTPNPQLATSPPFPHPSIQLIRSDGAQLHHFLVPFAKRAGAAGSALAHRRGKQAGAILITASAPDRRGQPAITHNRPSRSA